MYQTKIYDREQQRMYVEEFLDNNSKHLLVVHGESGVGKTVIVNHCISLFLEKNNFDLSMVESFHFQENINKVKPLSFIGYLKVLYKKHRITLASLRNSISGLSMSVNSLFIPTVGVSFKQNDQEIDEDGIDYLFDSMFQRNIQILYISNIELVNNKADFNALKYIKNKKDIKIKVILELGTLCNSNNDFELNELFVDAETYLEVEKFDEPFTKNLYSFVHKTQPPANIYNITMGNSFFVVHFNSSIKHYSMTSLVESKLISLDHESLKILQYLYILGGQSNINELKFYFDLPHLAYLLDALSMKKILQNTNNYYFFYHSFFMLYFNTSTMESLNESRNIIINKLLQKKNKTTRDYIIYINQLYDLNNNPSLVAKHGWSIFRYLYKIQSFNLASNILEILLETVDNNQSNYKYIIMAYLQTLILVGQGQKARIISNEFIKFIQNDILFKFLDAQILYQENRFEGSNRLIMDNIFDLENNHRLRAIILGHSIGNLIAMGKLEDAKNNFAAAMEASIMAKDIGVEFEITRFASKMQNSWTYGINMYTEALSRKEIENFPYTKAKLLHNVGLAKILYTRGKKGYREISEASQYFEKVDSPELTYNINAKAIYAIINFQYNKAIDLLLDAINLCNEQYDRFAIFTNLGNTFLLLNEFKKAEHFFMKALNAVQSSINPLTDPSVIYMSNFNLAVLFSSKEYWNKEKALTFLMKAKVPNSMKYTEEREKKSKLLESQIRNDIKTTVFRNQEFKQESWTVTEFISVLVKLSFYDFNLKIITDEDLPKIL